MEQRLKDIISFLRKKDLRRVTQVLGYATVALLVGVIGYSLFKSWRQIDLSSFSLDARYLLAPVVPHAVGLALAALAWGLIIRQLNPGSSLLKSAKIYYYTNVPKNLPGTVWYILGRVYLHEKEGLAKAVTTVAVVLETLLSLLASALVYMACLALRPGSSVVDWRYVVVIFLAGAALLHPAIFNRVVNYLITLLGQQDSTRVQLRIQDIGLWLALYVVIVGLASVALFLLVNAVYPVPADTFPLIASAWAISIIGSNLAFWLPAHSGIRDGILVVALNSFLPVSAALVIAVVWRLWTTVDELLWAAIATRL
jgi:hypothetical protein